MLARSAISLNAPSPQGVFAWSAWSDGGAQLHNDDRPRRRRGHLHRDLRRPAARPVPAAPASADARPVRPKPVAAWGFDEPSGTKVPGGKLAGPLRVRGGKFGNALDFDGVDDWVTVKAPKLKAAMTVEAWVYPTRRGGSLALRETTRGAAWSLYGDEAGVGTKLARGTAPKLRRWTHLAMTYDGATIRRYVERRSSPGRGRPRARSRRRIPAALRRQRGLEGVVQGPPRRDPRLRQRAHAGADRQADMCTPINAEVTKARRSRSASRAERRSPATAAR